MKKKIVRSRAPLRLGLGGGGTDIESFYSNHGGTVLNATIGLYAFCSIKTTSDNKIKFFASDLQEKFCIDCRSNLEIDSVLPLHKAVYNTIIEKYNGNTPFAHELVTYCDAPAGSGLGSSSTLVVAIIKAYAELLSLPFGDYDISHLAYEIERKYLGMKGGKQDQYAATFGGFNLMEFYKDDKVIINPLRVKPWIISELEQSLILLNTGTSRKSCNVIEQQNKLIENNYSKTIEAMLQIKQEAINMKEFLLKGNFEMMAKSIREGWEAKKKSSTGITNSHIDEVYDKVMNAGAMGGKISGAGGGGFMMFIVKPDKRMEILRLLSSEQDFKVFPCNFVESGSVSWTVI